MNRYYLYVDKEEELGEIIERIRNVKEKEIVLVIADATSSLSHKVNLEILKKELQNIGKTVYINTTDEKIKALSRQVGLPIFLEETEERIFDIRPPKKKKLEKSKEESYIRTSSPRKAVNIKAVAFYLLLLLVIVILGFVGYQVFQTRAEIFIEAKKIYVDINDVVTIKGDANFSNYENKILPGELVKVEIFGTESVTTTGQIMENKPLLNVVFMNYLEREIPLVMGTRIAYNDNIFRTTEKIIIPPSQNNEPGKRSVTAFPDSIKDENLRIPQRSDLKIVAWEEKKTRTEDGRLFVDVVKVKTENDYEYKSSAKVSSVTPEDVTNVKIKLEDSLKKSIANELAIKYPQSFYIYDPNLAKIEITDISHKVGDRSGKISATGKAVYETMITSKKEFEDFIKNLVNKEILKDEKNLIISRLDYEKIEILDFDSRKKMMTVGVKGKATLIPDVNPEVVKNSLRGKTISETERYFRMPGIEKVTIRLFPQWKEKLPEDPTKIKILIR